MAREWLKSRQTKYGAYAAVYIAGDHRGAGGRSTSWPTATTKSYDSTSNKQFSLSDQTIKVVRNLEHDVNIYYFDETDPLPAGARPAGPLHQSLAQAEVEFIDPVKKPQHGEIRRLPPRPNPRR